MSRYISLGIALDQDIGVAGLFIAGDGGVGSNDFLALDFAGLGIRDIEFGSEGNVLANGQAEDAVFGGQLKAIDGRVVGDLGLLGDGEFLEVDRIQDLLESRLLLFCMMLVHCRERAYVGGSEMVARQQTYG